MRPAGLTLLCFIATAPLESSAGEPGVEPAPGVPPPKLSARLAGEIRSSLPRYEPPAPAPPAGTATTEAPNPDVLVLPKITVQEKPRPRIGPTDFLTTKALNQKFARDYKNSLVGLDSLLNGFSIPLISPSLAARGRALNRARQYQDLNRTIELSKAADPKAAADLEREVDEMHRANDWHNRPAGR